MITLAVVAVYLSIWVMLGFITWIFYCAVMMLKQRRNFLPPVATKLGYAILSIGYLLDLTFNVISSIPFLDIPRELLFTARMKRLKAGTGWRANLATWFCTNLLCSIEENHCD